ncbi:MAG TPA: hypothetical protein VM241_02165 [Candidatus Thermoplasmatota archaeon]|nr:hypothetical protein [Candidatus Thermoplasmatota archaeon]
MRSLISLAALAGLALSGCLSTIPGVGGVIVTDRFTVPAHGYLLATPDGFRVPENSQLGWSIAGDGSPVEACLLKSSDRDAYLAGAKVACPVAGKELRPTLDFNGSLSDVYQAKAGSYAVGLHCLADHDCPVELYMGYATDRFVQQQAGHLQKVAITLPYAKQITLPSNVRTAQTFTLVGGTLDYSLDRTGGNTQWILFPATQVDDFIAGKTPSPVYAYNDLAKGSPFGSLQLGPGEYAVGLYCKEQAPCTFTQRLSEPSA